MSRITQIKVDPIYRTEEGLMTSFRYSFSDGTTHRVGPNFVKGVTDAEAQANAMAREVDTCHRKQESAAPKRIPYTDEEKLVREAEVEEVAR